MKDIVSKFCSNLLRECSFKIFKLASSVFLQNTVKKQCAAEGIATPYSARSGTEGNRPAYRTRRAAVQSRPFEFGLFLNSFREPLRQIEKRVPGKQFSGCENNKEQRGGLSLEVQIEPKSVAGLTLPFSPSPNFVTCHNQWARLMSMCLQSTKSSKFGPRLRSEISSKFEERNKF